MEMSIKVVDQIRAISLKQHAFNSQLFSYFQEFKISMDRGRFKSINPS